MRRPSAIIWTGLCSLLVIGGLFQGCASVSTVDRRGTSATPIGRELQVQFVSVKDAYSVDEPISFVIKTNKAAYCYLFNVNDELKKATMLFPNKYESANQLDAGVQTLIPSRKTVFKADRAGVEHLLLLVSTKPLTVPAQKEVGDGFHQVEKSLVDNAVKEIRVEPRQQEERVVKELDIRINAKQ